MNILPVEVRDRGRRDRRLHRRRAGLRASRASSAARLGAALPAGHELVLGIRPEGVQVAREAGPGMRQMEAHLIEPLGAYDIVDLKVGERFLKARTPSGFVRGAGRAGLGAARRAAGAFLRRRHAATSLGVGLAHG